METSQDADFQKQTLAKLDYIARKIAQNDSDRKNTIKKSVNEEKASSRQREQSGKKSTSTDPKKTTKMISNYVVGANIKSDTAGDLEGQYKFYTTNGAGG